jgi:hypothetical protein
MFNKILWLLCQTLSSNPDQLQQFLLVKVLANLRVRSTILLSVFRRIIVGNTKSYSRKTRSRKSHSRKLTLEDSLQQTSSRNLTPENSLQNIRPRENCSYENSLPKTHSRKPTLHSTWVRAWSFRE